MTIKTCGTTAGQAATGVAEFIAEIVVRFSKEPWPEDGLYLQVEAPERPMEVAMRCADNLESATNGWLIYDLENSRFLVKLHAGGQYWLNEEELVICCYKLLCMSYYLDGDEKRPFNPNISRVTEVVEALKALCVSER
ncbi:hypothetical protein [Corynebacterium sp. Marseille-Q2823]|uniref:hypothetical protein n=1 Tax=Corynebacterium sp. Marseille-Q2823 TaxID=2736606 RepID=UPI001589CF71|nr:hypothetical protein [Corynebacterium sp. Marseille-Q2823]